MIQSALARWEGSGELRDFLIQLRTAPLPLPTLFLQDIISMTTHTLDILPNEILTLIFRFVPEGEYPVTDDVVRLLVAVCQRWQRIILRDTWFWSHIALTNPDSVKRLDRRIAFSGNTPLVVRLDLVDRPSSVTCSAMMNTLTPHAHRLRYLDLSCRHEDMSYPPVLHTPQLEVLYLYVETPRSVGVDWDIRAPRLRKLRLHRVNMVNWSDVLGPCLTDIALQNGLVTSAWVLHAILDRCLNLKVLHFSAPILQDFESEVFEGLKPLDKLENMSLMSLDASTVTAILRVKALHIAKIHEIRIVCPASEHVAAALMTGFAPVEHVRLFPEARSLRVVDGAGALREFGSPRPRNRDGGEELIKIALALGAWRGSDGRGVFQSMQDVTVLPGLAWQVLSCAAPLGALDSELVVNLHLEPGDFFSYRFQWDPVTCVNGVKLRLICGAADSNAETVVHQEDVDYIATLLGQKKLEPEMVRVRMARSKDEDFDLLYAALEERMSSPMSRRTVLR